MLHHVICKQTHYIYTSILNQNNFHLKQAPADLVEDTTPKSLIEVVFSVNILFFHNFFLAFYLLPFFSFALYCIPLTFLTFTLVPFTIYILYFGSWLLP